MTSGPSEQRNRVGSDYFVLATREFGNTLARFRIIPRIHDDIDESLVRSALASPQVRVKLLDRTVHGLRDLRERDREAEYDPATRAG